MDHNEYETLEYLRNNNLSSYLRLPYKSDNQWCTIEVAGTWMCRLNLLADFLILAKSQKCLKFLESKAGFFCVNWREGMSLEDCKWLPMLELGEQNSKGIVEVSSWEQVNVKKMIESIEKTGPVCGGYNKNDWQIGGWIWCPKNNSFVSPVFSYRYKNKVNLHYQSMAQTLWQWDRDPLNAEENGYQISEKILRNLSSGIGSLYLKSLITLVDQMNYAVSEETKEFLKIQLEWSILQERIGRASLDLQEPKYL